MTTGEPVGALPVRVFKRGRGRPKEIPGPCDRVSTWVPDDEYRRLLEIAKREEMSISALVRQVLIVVLRKH